MSSSWKVVAVPALMLAVALAGCGESTSESASDYEVASYGDSGSGWSARDSVTDASVNSTGQSKSYESDEMLDVAGAVAEGAYVDAESYDDESGTTAADVATPAAEEDLSSMIRRTADIMLTTKKYDEADRLISGLVKKYSIVTLADNSSKDRSYYGSSTTYHSRHIKMRVKSEQFDEFCDAISTSSDAWDIENLNKSAEDVTKQYNDNSQKIDALRTRYDWYKQRIEQTEDEQVVRGYSDDMFDALEEIAYLENVNSGLQTDVNYSIVAISLTEDVGTTVDVDKSNNVWSDVVDEFSVLPDNISAVFGGFVLFVIRSIPTLIILAILLLIAWLIFKAYRNYRKKHPTQPKPKPGPAVMIGRNGFPVGQPMGQPVVLQQPMPAPQPMGQPAPAPVATPRPTSEEVAIRATEEEVPVAMTDEALSEGMRIAFGTTGDAVTDGTDGDTGRMSAFDAISDEVKANVADSDEFSDMFDEQEDDESEADAKDDEEERRAAIRVDMAQPVALADYGDEPMTPPSMWDDVPDATYAKIDDLRD